jgi:hypothetical protein
MRLLLKCVALFAVVIGLVVMGAAFFAPGTEPAFIVEHVIEIDASPDEVWAVFADFGAYPNWNPYAIKVEGSAAIGAILEVTIIQENFPNALVVRPTVVRWDPGVALGWHGTLLFEGLHDTDHYFEFEPIAPGHRTRMRHVEEFSGWLPGLLHGPEEQAHIERAFRGMNLALKRRVESPE